MVISKERIHSLQQEILAWYAGHQRSLPWRDIPFDTNRKERDPYKILISEVMSQQTQISRVIPKYEAWLERFPTVTELAKAPTSEVLKYWSGLGYNRRAINFQKCAKAIVEEYAGTFPRDKEILKKLPGIGEYTASAIACFAFNQQVAVVDTNVRKVILRKLSRHSGLPARRSGGSGISRGEKRDAGLGQYDDNDLTEKEIRKIAQQLLPKGRAYEWNQALMDYAAANLKKEKIAVPKQSTFKGSNRYYRGQTIKLLLEYNGESIKGLGDKLDVEEAFMEKIIQQLEKDGLVKRNKNRISLP